MSRPVCSYLAAAIVLAFSLTGTAVADPIQSYVATYNDSLGLNVSTPINLPALSQGGTVVLGQLPIVVQPFGSTPQPNTAINGTFSVDIGIAPTNGQPMSAFENIIVSGQLQGNILATAGTPPQFSGGYTGTALSVQFPTGTLYDVPDLQSLAQNPDRIHIDAQVVGGLSNSPVVQTSLVIDPPEIVIPGIGSGGSVPAAIPEPTSLAAFAIAIAGLALCRRLQMRRRSEIKSPDARA